MKLHSIDFKNYRKSIDKCVLSINKQTIIVGKNNTAKTSVIEIMTKFLTNTSTFKISDFNYKIIKKSFINDLYDKYKNGEKELLFKFPFIEMNIGLEINREDNLALIKDLLYEFDNNERLIIKCIYSLDKIEKIFYEFDLYNEKFDNSKDKIDFYDFFVRNFYNYYSRPVRQAQL